MLANPVLVKPEISVYEFVPPQLSIFKHARLQPVADRTAQHAVGYR